MLAYAEAVVAGTEPAGIPVTMACRRHLLDLEHGAARGLVWRPEKAEAALCFFEEVLYLEDGKRFHLEEFQAFIVGSLFGWYGDDGFRRFHTAYIELAKGNGKTPLAAGILLYGLLVDAEDSPEVYSAAVSADQARICFRDARKMVECSPLLRGHVQIQVGSLTVERRRGVLRPLSSEHRSLDGKRVHMASVDELHEHTSDIVVDKISAGKKQRRNALIMEITNSGVDRTSVCWRHHKQVLDILEAAMRGRYDFNDSWFGYIGTIDPCPACHAAGKAQPDETCPDCDDWRNEAVWRKANPGLGTILPISYLRDQVRDARTMTSKENLVKRLNFCLWTQQANRWINLQQWDACAGPEYEAHDRDPGKARLALMKRLEGRPCRVALDAATVSDFNAVVAMWDDAGRYPVLPFFFIPQDNLRQRIDKTGLRFDLWVKAGLIDATPGNSVDYAYIEQRIDWLNALYPIEEIAYDPWNLTDLVSRLMGKGYKCVPIRQGYATLSPPSKAFEADIATGRLEHAGNPVLTWMAGNVTATTDPAGNIKPDKEKSTEKIDGIVAAIMARDRWLRAEPVAESQPWGAFV